MQDFVIERFLKLTTSPNVHRFTIRIFLENFRGQVTRCTSETVPGLPFPINLDGQSEVSQFHSRAFLFTC